MHSIKGSEMSTGLTREGCSSFSDLEKCRTDSEEYSASTSGSRSPSNGLPVGQTECSSLSSPLQKPSSQPFRKRLSLEKPSNLEKVLRELSNASTFLTHSSHSSSKGVSHRMSGNKCDVLSRLDSSPIIGGETSDQGGSTSSEVENKASIFSKTPFGEQKELGADRSYVGTHLNLKGNLLENATADSLDIDPYDALEKASSVNKKKKRNPLSDEKKVQKSDTIETPKLPSSSSNPDKTLEPNQLNALRKSSDSKVFAWIQTDVGVPGCEQPPGFSASPNNNSSAVGSYFPEWNISGNEMPWLSEVDYAFMRISQGPFVDLLPIFVESCLISSTHDQGRKAQVFGDIQAVVKSLFGSKSDCFVYGSIVTDLALPASDIDILVAGYHPIPPNKAIHQLSQALLELDEHTLAKVRNDLQNSEEKRKENDKAPSENYHSASSSVVTLPIMCTFEKALNEEPPSLNRAQEQYLSPEELENAEEVYRDQIEKDYKFSNLRDYSEIWTPSVSNPISFPTERSKGTSTDDRITLTSSLIPRLTSINLLRLGEEEKEKVEETPSTNKSTQSALIRGSDDYSQTREVLPSNAGVFNYSATKEAKRLKTFAHHYTVVPTLDGPLYKVQTIASARVPVIKIISKLTAQRADITFGGGDHFRSLELTMALLNIFPAARDVIRFLKFCVAQLGIGDSTAGGVPSFTLFLMVRHVYNLMKKSIVDLLTIFHSQADPAKSSALANLSRVSSPSGPIIPNPSTALDNSALDDSHQVSKEVLNLPSASGTSGTEAREEEVGISPSASVPGKVSSQSGDVPLGSSTSQGIQNVVEPDIPYYSKVATAFIRDHVSVSMFFRDFCLYYGCLFNYERDGIHFSEDGSSEVIMKPYQCSRRGQLFHMTSPFDSNFDITAKMTFMRELQWLCEYFVTIVIPSYSFTSFLMWLSPSTAHADILSMRNHIVFRSERQAASTTKPNSNNASISKVDGNSDTERFTRPSATTELSPSSVERNGIASSAEMEKMKNNFFEPSGSHVVSEKAFATAAFVSNRGENFLEAEFSEEEVLNNAETVSFTDSSASIDKDTARAHSNPNNSIDHPSHGHSALPTIPRDPIYAPYVRIINGQGLLSHYLYVAAGIPVAPSPNPSSLQSSLQGGVGYLPRPSAAPRFYNPDTMMSSEEIGRNFMSYLPRFPPPPQQAPGERQGGSYTNYSMNRQVGNRRGEHGGLNHFSQDRNISKREQGIKKDNASLCSLKTKGKKTNRGPLVSSNVESREDVE